MPVTVADCMTGAVTIRANQSVRAAAKLMKANHTGFLVVIEDDHVVGVVTARDLVERIFAQGGSGDDTVRKACSEDLLSACPEDDLPAFIGLIHAKGLHRAPVLSDGQLVGVVSIDDLVATGLDSMTNDISRRRVTERLLQLPRSARKHDARSRTLAS
ncbi:CBS domain-containing protein [Tessaracoccus sp. OS52]|uniref:CBS domain-containing protein n=1 Tax=Tessaracoccus sp. OS52 TaxID=2886691 RepID=UPI001D0FD70D|nr:CBS domain-containing protein [Tessaracoccus sp. OS52]MCC2594343.1 CBS domain-containing protein [Tessaracoccus sp. OS52]